MSVNKPEHPTTVDPIDKDPNAEGNAPRKAFIEPELSSPINVLEVTSFQPPVASAGPVI